MKSSTDIREIAGILKKGGTILYPTDTIYGLGCNAADPEAVSKIYQLKKRKESKALIVLVDSFKMLESIIEEVPEVAWQVMKLSRKPTTIIYDRPKRVAENLIAADNTLAVRVTKNEFCRKLIRSIRGPLVSTSANLSGQPTASRIKDMQQELLQGVDCVVDLPLKRKNSQPSSIIRIAGDGTVQVIRK